MTRRGCGICRASGRSPPSGLHSRKASTRGIFEIRLCSSLGHDEGRTTQGGSGPGAAAALCCTCVCCRGTDQQQRRQQGDQAQQLCRGWPHILLYACAPRALCGAPVCSAQSRVTCSSSLTRWRRPALLEASTLPSKQACSTNSTTASRPRSHPRCRLCQLLTKPCFVRVAGQVAGCAAGPSHQRGRL